MWESLALPLLFRIFTQIRVMKTYGIYGCKDENGKPMYIGSSAKSISQLEWNHRNYHLFENGYESKFRKNLVSHGEKWTFGWIVEPYRCSVKEIEIKEGELINLVNPKYNVDKNPVKSSIKYGRYA